MCTRRGWASTACSLPRASRDRRRQEHGRRTSPLWAALLPWGHTPRDTAGDRAPRAPRPFPPLLGRSREGHPEGLTPASQGFPPPLACSHVRRKQSVPWAWFSQSPWELSRVSAAGKVATGCPKFYPGETTVCPPSRQGHAQTT